MQASLVIVQRAMPDVRSKPLASFQVGDALCYKDITNLERGRNILEMGKAEPR
ncbi:hypothetical protein Tco_1410412, partial [Tanacetum coccineum]